MLTLRQDKSLLILLGIDPTCGIAGSFLFRRALPAMVLCEARLTMKPLAYIWIGMPEMTSILEASNRMGTMNGGMRNYRDLVSD